MKAIHYPSPCLLMPGKALRFSFFLLVAGNLQSQIYIKPVASGTGSGTSWANAAGGAQLQTLINGASAGSQVWVAAGTYYPQAYPSGSTGGASNRDYAFTLKNGVAIYGGFAGTETLLSQRNVTANVTILSGDVGTAGTYTDDCYHIVLSVSNDNTAILDGFTIRYAYANGGGSISYGGQTINQNFGGAFFFYNAYPLISNCTVTGNLAATGGGIYNRNSGTPPVFHGCTFSSNTATSASDGGGACYNYSNTAITLRACSFSANKATGQDGGVAFGNSSSVFLFDSCTLSSNTAAANGGAIYVNNSSMLIISNSALSSNIAAGSGGAIVTMSSSVTTATNCSFTSNVANSATLGGGAIYSYSTGGSSASNCTFTSNSAVTYGGAFYGNSGSGGLIMSHCSFASNSATYGGGMANTNGSSPTVQHCKFSNGSATNGGAVYNNSSSPFFSVDSFFNNTATATSGMGGGGLANDAASNPAISHCWFRGNVTNGGDGAGQYDNSSAAPTDSSCVFEANLAKGSASNGGGIYHNSGNAKTFNCVFVDNSCKTNGGGYYNNASSSTIENCTFYNNSAVAGAAIYDPGGGNTKYYANMVWGNSPDGFAIGAGSTGGFKVKYNNFQAAYTGGGSYTNNTYTAPVFYNSGSYVGSDGKWATGDDGLHLALTSIGHDAVLISAGLNMPDDITVGPRPDIAGELYADEGAYEDAGMVLLPVQLLQFTAVPAALHTIRLQWQVDAGAQVSAYEVQRSPNGTDFTTIASLNAVAAGPIYEYTDAHADGSLLYYRLRLSESGKDRYSNIIAVARPAVAQLALWPSLVAGPPPVLYIGGAVADSRLLVTITDASGRVRWRTTLVVRQGDSRIPIDMPTLGRGQYFLQAINTDGSCKVLPFEKL